MLGEARFDGVELYKRARTWRTCYAGSAAKVAFEESPELVVDIG